MDKVLVHIKAAAGKSRTEKWPLAKLECISSGIEKDEEYFVVSSYENGEEVFFTVDKDIWDIWDDLLNYNSGEECDYDQLVRFSRNSYNILAKLFNEYVNIEITFTSQKLGKEYRYRKYINALEKLDEKCRESLTKLDALSNILNQYNPQFEEQTIICHFLVSMNLFLVVLDSNIISLSSILEKLDQKNRGGKYSFLSYRKDYKRLRSSVRARTLLAKKLTESYEQFEKIF